MTKKNKDSCLVITWMIKTLAGIESDLHQNKVIRDHSEAEVRGKHFENLLLKRLNKGSPHCMCCLLKEHFQSENIILYKALHRKLEISSPAFICAHKIRSVLQIYRSSFDVVDEYDWWFLRRVVVADSYNR